MAPRKPGGNPPTVRPGEKIPDSGIYREPKSGKKATMVEGEPTPPTPTKGSKWVQTHDTNGKR